MNFFLHLYIPSWLQKSFKFIVLRLLAKNWICSFLHALRQNSPPGYHYSPGTRKLLILHNSVFWRSFFPSKKRGRIMELEKLPKLNLQGYLPQVLINSTIFTIFKFLVSALLCHNLASTMLKWGGSLTYLIKFSLKNIVYRNNYMKYTTLLYPIFLPSRPSYAKLNIYPYIFSHFKKFHSSLLLNK